MGDDHGRNLQLPGETNDQPFHRRRVHGIETGGGFVPKQDLRATDVARVENHFDAADDLDQLGPEETVKDVRLVLEE